MQEAKKAYEKGFYYNAEGRLIHGWDCYLPITETYWKNNRVIFKLNPETNSILDFEVKNERDMRTYPPAEW